MTIGEAILHCEERAKADCSECAEEHRQLAEWLKELQLRKKGWISVNERFPECEEWRGTRGKEHYLRRFEIAVMSDTIEYFLAFYDGYKWFDKFGRTYAGIVAWKIHEPFNSLN